MLISSSSSRRRAARVAHRATLPMQNALALQPHEGLIERRRLEVRDLIRQLRGSPALLVIVPENLQNDRSLDHPQVPAAFPLVWLPPHGTHLLVCRLTRELRASGPLHFQIVRTLLSA